MALSFTKIRAAGIPSTGVKLAKMWKARKSPVISIQKVKIPTEKKLKSVNFDKMTKKTKLPKAKKIAIIKKAIKKTKNVGF